MGVKLLKAGIRSFTIYEEADEIGGTWRENTYPGVCCDVHSYFYSFPFHKNPNWSHIFSPGAEIQQYLIDLARTYNLYDHIEFGKEITKAVWRDGVWQLQTRDGDEITANIMIAATGAVHHPNYPEIKGYEDFQGAKFHTARWDHDVDLNGKRVAVIGIGSSGAQLIPEIVDTAAKLDVYQRTAQWIFPIPNKRYSPARKVVLKTLPFVYSMLHRHYMNWYNKSWGAAVVGDNNAHDLFRLECEKNLKTIKDPELRHKLTPDYDAMCKRLIFSQKFYPAIQKPNTELVTEGIRHIEPNAIVTEDGKRREADVIVLATGFKTHTFCRKIAMVGENGVTLEEAWSEGARAYQSIALHGFPNLFILVGPYSPIGNLSLMKIAELEVDYIIRCIKMIMDKHLVGIAPKKEAEDRFIEQASQAMKKTVWMTGCNSYYFDENGKIDIWPYAPEPFIEMMRSVPKWKDYQLIRKAAG